MASAVSPSTTLTAGQVAKFADLLTAALRKSNLPSEPTQQVLENQGAALADEFVASVRRRVEQITGAYSITPWPAGTSLADMVAAGKYDWTNGDVNDDHFPPSVSNATEVVLIHFNRVISTKDAERELDEQGLRPATLPELLALGVSHPELQLQFPIVALGTVWSDRGGNRGVASLGQDGSERYLYLHWFGHVWDENCRFAAVRK